jgi:hypothetical protein
MTIRRAVPSLDRGISQADISIEVEDVDLISVLMHT